MTCDVSVIICTRDRGEQLAEVFPGLRSQVLPEGWTAEVVVVDNGSRDATAAVVKRQEAFGGPVRLIDEPAPGLSHARNTGLAAARGRALLFTDDDVRLPPDWIHAMAAPLLSGETDAVAGSVRLAPHLLRPWMEPFHRAALASTDLLLPDAPGVMMGASMGFGRHVLERVPGFDVRLGAGALGTAEETLFAWQLLAAGYRIGRVAEPEVEHHCGEDRLLRQAYVEAARKFGRSYGYIAWHWLHTTHFGLDELNAWQIRREELKSWLRVPRWRWRNRGALSAEGIAHAEFYLLQRHAFTRQYRLERSRPRLYTRSRHDDLPDGRGGEHLATISDA